MGVVPPGVAGISDWQPLARGGFATVWQGRQEALDRPVAVKVDERPLTTDAERQRFLAEARAAGNLSGHPGIVTVHDAGILADGRPYLVMKLCTGGSLTRWLQPEHRPTPERVRSVGVRIADALAAAHASGVLHRDVKPPNILVDGYGNPALADFGLTSVEPQATTGLTLAFAPPEVLRGEPSRAAGDVYQLAATLYALLAGHPPYAPGAVPTSVPERLAQLQQPLPPVPGVPEPLMQVVHDGLAYAPEDRPTAAELRDRLAALEARPEPDETSRALANLAVRRKQRERRLVLALVAASVVSLLLVVAALGGVYLYEVDRSVTANISRELDLPAEVEAGERRPVKSPESDRTLNYLIIGTDDGNPQLDREGRSDALMLLHLNEARDRAYIITVPRDAAVTVPGHGQQRVNAAFPLGGPPLVVRTLERLTGARIDHVATIDFRGFVELTTDLGGVTVTNRTAFSSNGYRYPEGRITLAGDEALWYVREREALPSELARAENQRTMVKAILAKGLSGEVLSDPLRFTNFLGDAAKHIRVDKSLSNAELRSTAVSLRVRPDDITMLSIPVGKVRKVDGQNVQTIDPTRLAELSSALRNDTMSDYVKKYPRG